MATRLSTTLVSAMDTNAKFQGAAQFVEDTLVTTGGWIVTADAGQTLPSALVAPTAASQKRGYRVYNSNDGITPQIFMRINYGSGSGSSSPWNFAMWVTIGTGSDGSGNVTGVLANGEAGVSASVGQSSPTALGVNTVQRCYGSADPGRFTMALFVDAVVNNTVVFSLERSKDSSGADTGNGLIYTVTTVSASSIPFNFVNSAVLLHGTTYLITAGGTQPSISNGLNFVITGQNPSETFTPGDIGIGILIPFKGVAQQPGLNFLICNSNDVGVEGSINTVIYGVTHTYQHLNILKPGRVFTGTTPSSDANCRILMRYD